MNEGIGAFVKATRTERGMSQTALAEMVGVTRGYLSTLESDKIGLPSADTRRRLAKALGVTHLDLLVAAGEITREEIRAAGAEGVVERDPSSLVAQLCAAAEAVPDWSKAANVARGLIWTMQGVRYDQTPHQPGEVSAPPPPLAGLGQSR